MPGFWPQPSKALILSWLTLPSGLLKDHFQFSCSSLHFSHLFCRDSLLTVPLLPLSGQCLCVPQQPDTLSRLKIRILGAELHLWSAPPPWGQQCDTPALREVSLLPLQQLTDIFCFSDVPKIKPSRGCGEQLPGQRSCWARHSGEKQPSPSGKCRAQPRGAAAPERAALPWLIPGSLPGRGMQRGCAGCSHACPGPCLPFPSLPTPGEPRELGSDPPLQTCGPFSLCLV